MAKPISDNTLRFSDRASYYATGRPQYPERVIGLLRDRAGLTRDAVVADIGSGTGLSTELFLPHCRLVYGVEPNAEMRGYAERRLSAYVNFRSVAATAERTTLPDGECDFVTSASAIHWFDPGRVPQEFRRILKPGGYAVVMRTHRDPEASDFMRAFAAIFREYADRRGRPDWEELLRHLFGASPFETELLRFSETLSFATLRERLLSYSAVPLPGEPDYEEMMGELQNAFEQSETNGTISFHSETRVHWGRL